ncbi:hypothetical protein ACTMUQ_41685 [Streptomyces sp. SD11]|uniref:hypothetical protein n=1 Tax=Streptomyces sp. SD11 TaxID=3452209 RepID=UPI003F8C1869
MLTPYAFRHEPLWQAVGWSVMLAGTASVIVVLLRMERQLRIVDRQAHNEP